jgi:lysyl-tRNA synthetase class 2
MRVTSVRGRVTLIDAAGVRLEQDGTVVRVVWSTPSVAPPLVLGAWLQVSGEWQGQALRADAAEVLVAPAGDVARADSDFGWASAGGVQALHQRHAILRAIRAFFDGQQFVETETPAVVRSPGMELHLEALEVLGAGAPRFLHTSPEYHMKRLLACGMSRIYQLCKCYRRGEQGALHQPEFTMLEWYRAFADSEAVMRDTEQLVATLAQTLHGEPRIPASAARGAIDVTPPWPRLSVREAFARHAGVAMDDLVHDEEAFYRVLVERIEPQLGRGRPVFLTRYPASMAALARVCDDDASVADRFEAYVDGIELCNGFGELTDAAEQRRRFELDRARRERLGRSVYPIDERMLGALADGLPPSGGNALGVDRLIMLLLGARDIAEVVAFANERV